MSLPVHRLNPATWSVLTAFLVVLYCVGSLASPAAAAQQSRTESVSLSESDEAPTEAPSLFDRLPQLFAEHSRLADAANAVAMSGIVSPGASTVVVTAALVTSSASAAAHPMGAMGAANLISLSTARRCEFDADADGSEPGWAVLFPWTLGSSNMSAVAGPALSTSIMTAAAPLVGLVLHNSATMGVGLRQGWSRFSNVVAAYCAPTAAALSALSAVHGDGSAFVAGTLGLALGFASFVVPTGLCLLAAPFRRPTSQQRRTATALARRLAAEADARARRAERDAERERYLNEGVEAPDSQASSSDGDNDNDGSSSASSTDGALTPSPETVVIYDPDPNAPPPMTVLFTWWWSFWPVQNANRGAHRAVFFEGVGVAWCLAALGDMRLGSRNCAATTTMQMLITLLHFGFVVLVAPFDDIVDRICSAVLALSHVVLAAAITTESIAEGDAPPSVDDWIGGAALLGALAALASSGAALWRGYQHFTAVKEAVEQRAASDDAGESRSSTSPRSDNDQDRDRAAAVAVDALDGSDDRVKRIREFQVAVLGVPHFDELRLDEERKALPLDDFERQLVGTRDLAKLSALSPSMRQRLLDEERVLHEWSERGRVEPRAGPAPLPPRPPTRTVPSPYRESMFEPRAL